jgi:putative transposase
LLELCRYVELNPVRAGVVPTPGDWPWSSYLSHVGQMATPDWLDTAGLHGYLLGRDALTPADHGQASRRYAELVAAGQGVDLWAQGLRQQIYLGDDAFVQRMLELTDPARQRSRETPRAQRQRLRALASWLDAAQGRAERDEAIRKAHVDGGWSMTAIANALGLSVSRVSRVLAQREAALRSAQTYEQS